MEWQTVFAGAVAAYGGVRPAGRLLGVSPSTVSRLARGDAPDPKTAKHIGPLIGLCPTCEQSWPAAESRVLSLEEEVKGIEQMLVEHASKHGPLFIEDIEDLFSNLRARAALKENGNG